MYKQEEKRQYVFSWKEVANMKFRTQRRMKQNSQTKRKPVDTLLILEDDATLSLIIKTCL